MTQNVSWLSFFISNALTRSCIHFFPSSDGVSAPYPANCTLTLFGAGLPPKSVVLEGGRLNSPDGVRLEDAFPALRQDLNGLFGVRVDLGSTQPRLDLNASSCVVELNTQGTSTRFWPYPFAVRGAAPAKSFIKKEDLEPQRGAGELKLGLFIEDAFCSSSIVAVNDSAESRICFVSPLTGAAVPPEGREPQQFKIEPYFAGELNLSPDFYADTDPQECSWGRFKGKPAKINFETVHSETGGGTMAGETSPAGAPAVRQEEQTLNEPACFLVYRENGTRRIISVMAL